MGFFEFSVFFQIWGIFMKHNHAIFHNNDKKEICSEKRGFEKRIYLTFDLDWADDVVLGETLDIIEENDITATIFVTHGTRLLERMRRNGKIELGLHPNYNGLLDGADAADQTAESIIEKLLTLVPEAKSVRAHCLVQSSRLMCLYKRFGLTHNADVLIPGESGIKVAPFRHFSNGLTITPYIWEDDVYCLKETKDWSPVFYVKRPGLKIFDFHPIHIFLNTKNMEAYEMARPYFRRPECLREYISADRGEGTRVFLLALIEEAKARGCGFGKIGEISYD